MSRYVGQGGGVRFGHGFPMTTWVKRLLIANFAVFLIQGLGIIPDAVWRSLTFQVPGFLTAPWSFFTYMFVHANFMHVFGNMLILFFFGPPLENKFGSPYFIKYYLATGVSGAVLAPFFVGGQPTSLLGASGAVFGVLIAFAMNWPDAKIYLYFLFPVPAKWFVGVLGLFTLYATARGSGGGIAHFAHLGGMVTGFVILRWGDQIGRRLKGVFFREKRSHVRVESGGAAPKKRRPPPKRGRRGVDGDSLDEVDRILDKIRETGMDSLSAKERSFLDDMSRRYKTGSETRRH
ncbi:MAG: rhomboid family intramembrane serine protease [Gemmatimonadota bacterium]